MTSGLIKVINLKIDRNKGIGKKKTEKNSHLQVKEKGLEQILPSPL